jgi:hypothetical protein
MTIDELRDCSAGAEKGARNAPVIVITYAGSGADRLRSVLSAFSELACTQQTGILPLCHHAVSTWQTVDGIAGGGVSPLAAASLRALSAGLMTATLARHGGKRWCEFTTAGPAAAQSFARICPDARFLIVHSRADTVVRAIIGASRWGLEGPEFAPYVSAHPASQVAALASYWAVHTAQQLEFEQANPEACHRVRIEDLADNAAQAVPDISAFLGLKGAHASPPLTPDDQWNGEGGMSAVSAASGLPLGRIPAPLLAQVNDLHRGLGYPPVMTAANNSAERIAG